jgi:hypothetical protein
MIMIKPFRFAAAPLIAGAIVVLTTAAALAFSQQMLTPNGNYDFNYGPLDDSKLKSDSNTNKSDPNSPGFHFSVGGGQTDQFGFHSFGGDNNKPPEPYARPLGNGN